MTIHDVMIAGDGAAQTIARYQEKLTRNPGDCGMDLFPQARQVGDISYIHYGDITILSVPTKVSIAVPDGYFAWITPRSSTWDKLMGAEVLPGIIDHGYTGEYRIRIRCAIQSAAMVKAEVIGMSGLGMALAQVIIIPYTRMSLRLVERLPDSGRGAQGYGSTDRS